MALHSKTISNRLARAVALFVSVPLGALPAAAQTAGRTTSGRELTSGLRETISGIRTDIRERGGRTVKTNVRDLKSIAVTIQNPIRK